MGTGRLTDLHLLLPISSRYELEPSLSRQNEPQPANPGV